MKTSIVDGHSVERLLLLAGALSGGLIDALGDGEARPAGAVAVLASTDPRATRIVLDALTAESIVERTAGADDGPLYRLSALGRAHLVDEGPELERSGLLHHVNKLRGWLELPEVIRTGAPTSRGMARAHVRNRSLAMGERDPAVLDEIVDQCLAYAGTIHAMIDVGGAVGHLARQFARRGVKATLFDQVEVMPVAREFLGDEADRMRLVAGDYTVSLPPGPFDLVYFGNVFHIYGAETNARVAREAFTITAPGGAMAIQDYVRDLSEGAAMFAVNMLRSTVDGEVWTEAEYQGWLRGAGFVDVRTVELETSGSHLILGRRPRFTKAG